ncbi:IS3 family transposase [Flavobacterium sp. UBA7680]|uniref:IS3 family transposase n=1 Tax=Flavobacterium sp. UBA7680 TaxID=1946559 RepID=UPI0025BD4F8F|nr:IS3 family transposase [Flavobacterium sp. UBA7680]
MKKADKIILKERKILELEKKIKKSDLKFEILKSAGICLHQGKSKVFDFILNNEKTYSIRLMSEALGINRREYHAWKNVPLNETQKRKILMQKEITSIFFTFERRYGSDRIATELQKSGYQLSAVTVRKYMSEMGLTSMVKKN